MDGGSHIEKARHTFRRHTVSKRKRGMSEGHHHTWWNSVDCGSRVEVLETSILSVVSNTGCDQRVQRSPIFCTAGWCIVWENRLDQQRRGASSCHQGSTLVHKKSRPSHLQHSTAHCSTSCQHSRIRRYSMKAEIHLHMNVPALERYTVADLTCPTARINVCRSRRTATSVT